MKRQSNTIFTEISNKQLENLTTVVDETIALGFCPAKSKIFSTADLWNIQRRQKSRIQRRFWG